MSIEKYTTKAGIKYRYRFKYENESYQEGNFTSAKDAKIAEAFARNKATETGGDAILFPIFCEEYLKDIKRRVKKNTYVVKERLFKRDIIPAFTKPIGKITSLDVRKWQDKILDANLEGTSMHTINAQMKALFSYGQKHYNLKRNPVQDAGHIGAKNRDPDKYVFWTKEQFDSFIALIDHEAANLAFHLLYYSGVRSGEMYALRWKHIDFENNIIHVKETRAELPARDGSGKVTYIYTKPKTRQSIRDIHMPKQIMNMLVTWKEKQYKPKENDLVLPLTREILRYQMNTRCEKANVPKMRIHDFRHSHASMLISMDVNIFEVSKRLGHDDIGITAKIYSHLYTSKQEKLAKKLENILQ